MANSTYFDKLNIEIKRLKTHFLPKNWSPTGDYSEQVLDHVRAFKLLVHAEFESFLENITINIVEQKYKDWNTYKKPSYIIICLLAASHLGWKDFETEEQAIELPKIKRDYNSINEFVERAVNQFRDIIKNNNGIKSRDMKRLLMPLGITLSELDPTWLIDMDSYGGKRGYIAHNSRLGVRTPLDPKTEKDNVDKLLNGLKDLDEKINNLLSLI